MIRSHTYRSIAIIASLLLTLTTLQDAQTGAWWDWAFTAAWTAITAALAYFAWLDRRDRIRFEERFREELQRSNPVEVTFTGEASELTEALERARRELDDTKGNS